MDISVDHEMTKEMEFQSICDSVTARSIYTLELYKGTKIKGEPIRHPGDGLSDNGDEELTKNKSTWAGSCEDAKIFSSSLYESPDSLIVSMWDEIVPDKTDKVIFGMAGYQKQSKIGTHRGNPPYFLYIEMPRESAIRLVEMVTFKPNLIEKFYQKTYEGLDALLDSESGLRRIKTDSVKIINIKDKQPLKTCVELKLLNKIGVID